MWVDFSLTISMKDCQRRLHKRSRAYFQPRNWCLNSRTRACCILRGKTGWVEVGHCSSDATCPVGTVETSVKRAVLAAGVRGDLSEVECALKLSGDSLCTGLASSAEADRVWAI